MSATNTPQPAYWIWQQPAWPEFCHDSSALSEPLRQCHQAQAQLLGAAGAVPAGEQALDTLLQNIITSSAIEGENLNAGSVRSSLARRLGLPDPAPVAGRSERSEGVAELMLDATGDVLRPLDLPRLLHWHRLLFAQGNDLLGPRIHIGALRGDEPMQVVSGRIDRPVVHFKAPPREGLERELDAFLAWFASSRHDPALDPLLRAGIAHFWFVTLHPFDDGNGRLTRALTDLALAQAAPDIARLYAMSASILDDRSGYYRILESSQRGNLDITAWLHWFLHTLLNALQQAQGRIARVLDKARFWQVHASQELHESQRKVLNRLLDGGPRGFADGISASQYQAVAKVSKATATRHLADLLDKRCIQRLPGGGRSTRYHLLLPGSAGHATPSGDGTA